MGDKISRRIDLGEEVFDIKDKKMPRGAWWWWFWLFFFDNPENPSKPRQLMILWSTKKVSNINCNGKELNLEHTSGRDKMEGAVASWYFDGEKMNHNFLLEKCNLRFSDNRLSTDSSTFTSYNIENDLHTVEIGEEMEFMAKTRGGNDFEDPVYNSNDYVGNKGYSIAKANRMDLTAMIEGDKCHGSAYFQRVFVNSPAVPWFWGIFHFENGGGLSYYNPSFMGKSVKEDIEFFDGENYYRFDNIEVERIRERNPVFHVKGEDEDKKIDFIVHSYAQSSWTFRRKFMKVIPTKMTYHEYPAKITDIKFLNKKTGEVTTEEDVGEAIGNAEHNKGLLL